MLDSKRRQRQKIKLPITRTIKVIRLVTVFANRSLLSKKLSIRGQHRDPVTRFAQTGQARRCSQQNLCKGTGDLLSINIVPRHHDARKLGHGNRS